MGNRMEAVQGDITKMKVDAIVNAANSSLLGGGGVDGAIHRAAGPELVAECATLGGCATGEAKITRGYNLPAKYVIHTVGPVWRGGTHDEEKLLADCYRNSLRIAAERGLKTMAFPAISTGVYRFPPERACRIAVDAAREFLAEHPAIEKVSFVCFDTLTFGLYKKAVA
jgi:O-acetyl-ADP-ribose deacetylase (regulator of RNase III)